MGEGSGRGSGRVGSDFLSAIAGRSGVGSTFRRVGSGRVQEKWPVDNSDTATLQRKLSFMHVGVRRAGWFITGPSPILSHEISTRDHCKPLHRMIHMANIIIRSV